MATTALATSGRSQEAEAFLDSRQHTGPEVVSACAGWTAHEVTAHLAGIAAEVTRHLVPYLAGEPVPPTRTFEEREPAYRELSDAELVRRLEAEEQRMRTVVGQVLAREPGAVVPWTGRRMAVAKFLPHLRNEFAIHRWDIVGDDDISYRLLGQPELTEHAVGELGEILVRRGREHDPSPERDLHVSLRADGAPDVRLVVESGRADLQLSDSPVDEPHVELDAPARTLVIWGRRPERRDRFRSYLDQPSLHRLQALLAGY
jgi:Mycothiol maleylpyruvate isomerase N-terminal domain